MNKKYTLGQTLAKRRSAVGLSQNDLARKLGYGSGQFVSNWERGLANPPAKDLKALATVLKMDKAELAGLLISEFSTRVVRMLGVVR